MVVYVWAPSTYPVLSQLDAQTANADLSHQLCRLVLYVRFIGHRPRAGFAGRWPKR